MKILYDSSKIQDTV